jgi:acyl carrier protein
LLDNCRIRTKTGSSVLLEQRIAGIWRDLLRRECIDVTENFFELGGHSLLAMRLVSQLGEAFQIDLPVRTVFDAPTIEALSREIVLSLVRQRRNLITENRAATGTRPDSRQIWEGDTDNVARH